MEADFNAWQSYLDRIIREPENESLTKAAEAGKKVIGYTCSYVPRAMLSVDGLVPVRMRAGGNGDDGGTEIADIYLSQVNCSYSRSLLEYALDHHFDFLEGWVFAAGCDHIRRLLDNLDYLVKPEFTHMVDAPHRRGEAALDWFKAELRMLGQKLTEKFGVDVSTAALKKSIQRENAFNKSLRTIANLRKNQNPPLSGTEFQRIMIASLVAERGQLIDILDRMAEELKNRKGRDDYRARLMVVGGNIDDIDFIRSIESTGGLVVADRFCTGSMPGATAIPETDDPLTDIARHTLDQVACPRMMEDFERRLADILFLREAYQVDGIIVENIKFCDIWGIETGLLTKRLKAAGVHVLRIERDYRLNGEGQLQTRVQAFLESMGK